MFFFKDTFFALIFKWYQGAKRNSLISFHAISLFLAIYYFSFQARGKSGPLFSFDVHDDIRMVSDATVEKDESHAGKNYLPAADCNYYH